jgi:hypothetical protein
MDQDASDDVLRERIRRDLWAVYRYLLDEFVNNRTDENKAKAKSKWEEIRAINERFSLTR